MTAHRRLGLRNRWRPSGPRIKRTSRSFQSVYYTLGSDPALWPAGERREGEHIMYDKGYYHSYRRRPVDGRAVIEKLRAIVAVEAAQAKGELVQHRFQHWDQVPL